MDKASQTTKTVKLDVGNLIINPVKKIVYSGSISVIFGLLCIGFYTATQIKKK